MRARRIFLYAMVSAMIIALTGCEAFVRKFTRKPKNETPAEEMVLVPEEYKGPGMTKEQLYRQYFVFWKSWQDELVESLSSSNHKKQLDCVKEAIKNLQQMRSLLVADQQKKVDVYINQLQDLRDCIDRDAYGLNARGNISTAERIKRNILRDLSYQKVKNILA
ncbi:MAG TPA: hypothetical protein VMD52_04950 [Patescibacteria group bacterium]|nr:hypothetical protein [Patescibacteria group bacterium]